MTKAQSTYAVYLQSQYWQEVTELAKKRAGYKCQVCNSPHDLNGHHRDYSHRGREKEFLDDVVCLCRRCHEIFHGKKIEMPAPVKKPAPVVEESVLITRENHRKLRCTKEPWHWMLGAGIDPRKSGWAKRAIGHTVPRRFMR